jgi:hypothetical protein
MQRRRISIKARLLAAWNLEQECEKERTPVVHS